MTVMSETKEKKKDKAKKPKKFKAEVHAVAERLNESETKPMIQIEKIMRICGREFIEVMLENTLTIEAEGGMMTANDERRRTPGGVFFFLIRYALPEDIRDQIFPTPRWAQRVALPPSKFPPIDWENRADELADIFGKETGKVLEEVNINIKGRPGHIEKRADMFVALLEATIPDNQTFPRGLPEVPQEPTRYFLLISEQQWDKHVKNGLEKDETTFLNVDGGCYYDEELEGIAILVRSVKVQKPKPPKPPEEEKEPPSLKDDEHAARAKAPTKKTAPSFEPPVTIADDLPDTSGMPDAIAKKLRPLYGARKLFRKRLADIEAMPPDRQSGLQAAKVMLERTEKQISELEKQAEEESSE